MSWGKMAAEEFRIPWASGGKWRRRNSERDGLPEENGSGRFWTRECPEENGGEGGGFRTRGCLEENGEGDSEREGVQRKMTGRIPDARMSGGKWRGGFRMRGCPKENSGEDSGHHGARRKMAAGDSGSEGVRKKMAAGDSERDGCPGVMAAGEGSGT